VIAAHEDFEGTFPFKPQFSTAAGFRMHYVDEGAAAGARADGPIVCLHGEPTWGYLYRNFIPPLRETHRVIVPDHMGFGKSETPQDREYTLATHTANLTALIEELDLRDITFVAQDWGGPIAGAFSVRHPERVKRLCLMNTLLGYGRTRRDAPAEPTPWFRWIGEHTQAGTLDAVLGNLGSHVLSVMKIIGFENSAAVTDTWIRAYSAPFPTRESCKGAIEFPLDVHLRRIVPYVVEGFGGVDALKRIPAMLAVGLRDHAIAPEAQIADFRALYPEAPVVELPNAGHFCQEDAPETLVALIQQFIQLT
jgi:haloalkane dehalogenase